MKRRTALATAATITMVLTAGAAAAQATGMLGGERVRNRDVQPVATVGTEATAPSIAETTAGTRPTLPPVVVTRQEFADTVVVVTSAPPEAAAAPESESESESPAASSRRTATPSAPAAAPGTEPASEPTSPPKVTAPRAGNDGPPATFRNPRDNDDNGEGHDD